ncbi:MAG TPA: hypothetical protein VED87_11160, partial [Methylocystis sp.]|nr:hypothetical protein [Methylocystis sp.]
FSAVPIAGATTPPLFTWVPNYVTPPRAFTWTQLSPNQSITKKYWHFAWNLMAGVSYDVTQNVKVDVHYRLLDGGTYTGLPGLISGASAQTKDLISQEVRLGVRLVSD